MIPSFFPRDEFEQDKISKYHARQSSVVKKGMRRRGATNGQLTGTDNYAFLLIFRKLQIIS